MKLRHFYRLDNNGQPIAASNVRRLEKPKVKGTRWKELDNFCCNSEEISCTCGPRFFVQVDPRGTPIDYTIIKRDQKPLTETGISYREIDWKSPCCTTISWTLALLGNGTGSLVIQQNGVTVVTATTNAASGSFNPTPGALIEIVLTNTCVDTTENVLSVQKNGATPVLTTDTPETTVSFVFQPGDTYVIAATLDCEA